MLNDAALVVGANAIDGVITHMQLHSGARGASGTSNAIGTRVRAARPRASPATIGRRAPIVAQR